MATRGVSLDRFAHSHDAARPRPTHARYTRRQSRQKNITKKPRLTTTQPTRTRTRPPHKSNPPGPLPAILIAQWHSHSHGDLNRPVVPRNGTEESPKTKPGVTIRGLRVGVGERRGSEPNGGNRHLTRRSAPEVGEHGIQKLQPGSHRAARDPTPTCREKLRGSQGLVTSAAGKTEMCRVRVQPKIPSHVCPPCGNHRGTPRPLGRGVKSHER